MELTYLFECHFTDGTFIQQTPEDVSKTDPSKSAFYDVLQRNDEVMIFAIVNDDHTYVVDLRDGHFEIDGIPFTVHDKDELPHDCKFRVVYFRRNVHTITQGYVNMTDSSVKYHIGWQTTVEGKNYQKTIAIA